LEIVDQNDVHSLIMNYLVHYCYPETSKACYPLFQQKQQSSQMKPQTTTKENNNTLIDMNRIINNLGNTDDMEVDDIGTSVQQILQSQLQHFSNSSETPDREIQIQIAMESIYNRKNLVELIYRGKIEEAVLLTNKLYPELLTYDVQMSFYLQCQVFIELVRQRKTTQALKFAQDVLSVFGLKDKRFLDILQEIVPLLAYDDPESSPIGTYMTERYREDIADRLNCAILAYLKVSSNNSLHILMKQLTLVSDLLYNLNDSKSKDKKAQRFRLHDIVENQNKSD